MKLGQINIHKECNKQNLPENVNIKQELQISRNTSGCAPDDLNQFKMRSRWSCYIVLGLFFLSQLSNADSDAIEEQEELLVMQLRIENLIEKIINFSREYYYVFRDDMKCFPDVISVNLMDTIKTSIDCVEENERNFSSGCTSEETYTKNFLRCLSSAKTQVKETINSINSTLIQCSDTLTEKSYQINVTTTFTKTFNINIKNGLEITKKEIELRKHRKNCLEHDIVSYADYDYESSAQTAGGKKETTFNPEDNEGNEEIQTRGFHTSPESENSNPAKNRNPISLVDSVEESNGQHEFDDYENPTMKPNYDYEYPTYRKSPYYIYVSDSQKIDRNNAQQQKFLEQFGFEKR